MFQGVYRTQTRGVIWVSTAIYCISQDIKVRLTPFKAYQSCLTMTRLHCESIRRFYNAWAMYTLYFWVFAVSILSVFNTNILILLLMMIHIQIRAVSIVIIEQLLIIIIVVFLVLVAIICLEVDIVLGGAVEHIICISLALPPSLGGSNNSLAIANQHKHSPYYHKSMYSNTIHIYYS